MAHTKELADHYSDMAQIAVTALMKAGITYKQGGRALAYALATILKHNAKIYGQEAKQELEQFLNDARKYTKANAGKDA